MYRSLVGSDASRSELRSDWQAFGRIGIAIWPLKEALSEWRRHHPNSSWKHGLGAALTSNPAAANSCINRLSILGSGKTEVSPPSTREELLDWWKNGAV